MTNEPGLVDELSLTPVWIPSLPVVRLTNTLRVEALGHVDLGEGGCEGAGSTSFAQRWQARCVMILVLTLPR